jgi:hypothetical protein
MRHKGDNRTLDLLTWQPASPAKAFEPEKVRAASLRSILCRAIALSLKECGREREQVAEEIGQYLGESCTKAMLDAYASEAREDHTMPLVKFLGLIHATRDMRLLQILAQQFGWAVIPERYLGAVEEAVIAAKEEELGLMKRQARRRWKGI